MRRSRAKTSGAPHLVHIFPTFDVGGVQGRMADIINHFADRFRHTILSLDGAIACRNRLLPDLSVDFPRLTAVPKSILGRVWQASRMLRALQPDLVLTYNWGAIEWLLAERFAVDCPSVHLESGFGPDEVDRQVPRRVWTRRLALGRCHRLVVPSKVLADLAEHAWRIEPSKILYIPNGVDYGRFNPGRNAREATAALVIGSVSPLRREKNLARLLRCCAPCLRQGGAQLTVIGDGPEMSPLQELAAALSIADCTTLAGHSESIARDLRGFDIFALSSDTEQMPNALLQAMATGLPVVATDVGDIKQIVAEPNRRYIVAKDDDRGFSEAVAALLGDATLRQRLGQANRRRVETDYGQGKMFAAYGDLFDRLLAGSRGTRQPSYAGCEG